jgi:hypothetical protein
MLNTFRVRGITRAVARLTASALPPNARLLQGHLLPPPVSNA